MANLDFFATRADHHAVVDFLFANTDLRMFESYSEYGEELREFRCFEELTACYDVGSDTGGNGCEVLLQLWSPSVEPGPKIERKLLDPRQCEGHTFRYLLDGAGLIQLYLGGVHGRILTSSHFGHNSEARARNWGISKGVDWCALKSLSNKIQYHIGKRLEVARVPGRPVLAEAFSLARIGYILKDTAGCPARYELPVVD